jgi:hypothetical protein
MNMFFTFDNSSIDPMNNPYFKIRTYEANQYNQYSGINEVKMFDKCSEKLLKIYGGRL